MGFGAYLRVSYSGSGIEARRYEKSGKGREKKFRLHSNLKPFAIFETKFPVLTHDAMGTIRLIREVHYHIDVNSVGWRKNPKLRSGYEMGNIDTVEVRIVSDEIAWVR